MTVTNWPPVPSHPHDLTLETAVEPLRTIVPARRRLAEALLSSHTITAVADVPGGALLVAMRKDATFLLTQRPKNNRHIFASYDELLGRARDELGIPLEVYAEQAIWYNILTWRLEGGETRW